MTTAILYRIERGSLFLVYLIKFALVEIFAIVMLGLRVCAVLLGVPFCLQAVFSASPTPRLWLKLKSGTRNDVGVFGLNSYSI